MKKILLAVISTLLIFNLCGCIQQGEELPTKTIFDANENASIDNISITLLNITEGNNSDNNIIVKFKIQNNNKNNISITNENFDLIIDNINYKPNNQINANLAYNNSLELILYYNVPKKESYKLIFYSGVVSNNIAFNGKILRS